MKRFLAIGLLLGLFIPISYAQSYFDDDIYYNPKKDKNNNSSSSKKSNYIANMADMDVDLYNRRGEQYYVSPIDTIGVYAENGEDFVYTQQIQKYYNPTIVVDNANLLGDVLSNAYGNVEIIINDNGIPVFSPYYGWNYPYYWSGYSPLSWNLSFGGWGWNVGFFDPWYSWTWGPSWSWGWGPGWNWGWGPSWGWNPGPGPGWGPGWRPGPPLATWRPGGNRPVGPNPGWSGNTRPGGNFNMSNHGNLNYGSTRPAAGRPSSGVTKPGNNIIEAGRPSGVVNNNGRWEYNTSGSTGHRQSGTGVVNKANTGNMTPAVNTSKPNTPSNKVSTPSRNNNNTTNRNNYNSINNSNNRVSTPSRNTGGRSTSGGGRTTGGGGGRGRHR